MVFPHCEGYSQQLSLQLPDLPKGRVLFVKKGYTYLASCLNHIISISWWVNRCGYISLHQIYTCKIELGKNALIWLFTKWFIVAQSCLEQRAEFKLNLQSLFWSGHTKFNLRSHVGIPCVKTGLVSGFLCGVGLFTGFSLSLRKVSPWPVIHQAALNIYHLC